MNKRVIFFIGALFFLIQALPSLCQTVVRVGAFPNITHAQAMVGKANGWFEKALGPSAKIQWTSFNAGPSAIEALFSGAIDMTYVGPNPAISGYVRSNGEALRIVAGAASGGVALVVRNDSGIRKPEDFHGKRVASPQLGNTQDVALARLVESSWHEVQRQRWRRASDSAGQSRPVDTLFAEAARCFLGSRALGHTPDS